MQRKVVTVVFCDVVGSTALGESVDPEALQGLLARYFERMKVFVESHGGIVEKFIGDAVMAVFGVPQVHEDDALRACRAAVEMRAAFPELGVHGRIGINTGEVVTGTEERLATGDAVNVAARLQQAAAPDEILVGEATLELIHRAVEVEPVEPLALKGKTSPVPAHRLLSVLDTPERSHESRFVGREGEVEVIREAWQRVQAERRCELITILGDPGIGKSRLVAEAVAQIEARILRGRCLPYGDGITYWPVVELIKQLDALPSAPAAAAALRSLLGEIDAATTAEEIAWAFRKLVDEQAPLVIVLDDIQWGDETFLDLVEGTALLSSESPILLICIARPELADRRPQWPSTVRLEPLPVDAVDELIGEQLPADLRARIVTAAAGNPLFLVEMLAMAASGEAVDVPPTLRALLAARLDQLDPAERRVLEAGAIEGEIFHRGAVQALIPGELQITPRLAGLVRRELIRPDRALLPGEDGFRFRHLLIRDAAYDTLPKSTRADLHERFADWLEHLGANLVELDEILGYHLEQACRYRFALGNDDEHARGLALRAARLLADAGRRAQTRLDVGATRSLLSRAAELIPEDAPDRASLLVLLGKATFYGGDVSAALAYFTDAKRAAAAAGIRPVELQARMRELGCLVIEDTEAALAEAQATIAELGPGAAPAALIDAWWLVGWIANLRADNELRERAVMQTLELARRAGLRREAAEAARSLAFVLASGPTPVADAIAIAERELKDFPDEPECELALLYAYAGRHAEAAETMANGRRAQLELGHVLQHAADSMDVGWVALLAGEPERAEQELREGAARLALAGEHGWLSTVAAVLAEVLYQLGRDEEAEEWTQRSEEVTLRDDVLSQALWRACRAKVMARRGESEEAHRLAVEAVDWGRRGDPPLLGDALAAHAEVLQLLGRDDEARPVLEEALVVYERKGIVPSITRTRAALDEL